MPELFNKIIPGNTVFALDGNPWRWLCYQWKMPNSLCLSSSSSSSSRSILHYLSMPFMVSGKIGSCSIRQKVGLIPPKQISIASHSVSVPKGHCCSVRQQKLYYLDPASAKPDPTCNRKVLSNYLFSSYSKSQPLNLTFSSLEWEPKMWLGLKRLSCKER